jgi:superfamily I DNA/RNA helicase
VGRIAPTDWTPVDIDDLEPAAWLALRHQGSACVVAGPGAGKTEFLAQRACYLLATGECRRPRKILAISFKRDAARNLAERVGKRAPEGTSRFVSMTFDAFTKGIVDRFHAALPAHWELRGDYEIRFPARRDVEAFLDDLAAANDEWRAGLFAFPRDTFLPEVVGDYLLPIEPPDPRSAGEFAILEWWKRLYTEADPQRVEFVMLNRLAELIIRATPQLRKALQLTYPFVFVDEFQDTTFAQYSFLRSVFAGGHTTVTAVGDNKQRIMGWAGALDDAFEELQADFAAQRFELEWNFRSSDELIEIQHVVARTLDDSATRAVSQVESSIDGDAAEIWRFDSEQAEARYIAEWILNDATNSGRSPSSYALLTRQKAADFEPLFESELARVGIRLRNDDREVGKLRLQDLLADELALLLIGLLRLAATAGGNRQIWIAVSDSMSVLRDLEQAGGGGYTADRVLSTFVKRLRRRMRPNPPALQTALDIVDLAMEFIDAEAVRRSFPTHRAADAVELVVEAFKARMAQVANEDLSWAEVCDELEGRGAVPLMTVHKSKGLEYHTVFFLSIDDNQWWSYRREPQASTSTFFVGLSRAEQRTIFTYCASRGDRESVVALYDLLSAAGVTERQPSDPTTVS